MNDIHTARIRRPSGRAGPRLWTRTALTLALLGLFGGAASAGAGAASADEPPASQQALTEMLAAMSEAIAQQEAAQSEKLNAMIKAMQEAASEASAPEITFGRYRAGAYAGGCYVTRELVVDAPVASPSQRALMFDAFDARIDRIDAAGADTAVGLAGDTSLDLGDPWRSGNSMRVTMTARGAGETGCAVRSGAGDVPPLGAKHGWSGAPWWRQAIAIGVSTLLDLGVTTLVGGTMLAFFPELAPVDAAVGACLGGAAGSAIFLAITGADFRTTFIQPIGFCLSQALGAGLLTQYAGVSAQAVARGITGVFERVHMARWIVEYFSRAVVAHLEELAGEIQRGIELAQGPA